MKQLSSNFINMAVSLTVICVLAASLLSYFVNLTQEKIAASDKQKQSAAVAEVLPFEGAEIITEKNDSVTIYRAMVDGKEVGVAVESYSNSGFNGQIKVMVGFDSKGNLLNYSVLDQKETPGLGTKMVDWFKPQVEAKKSLVESIFGFQIAAQERKSSVIGKNQSNVPLRVSKDGGDIDAITAATISSRAFLEAVNRAFSAVNADVVWDGTSSASAIHHDDEVVNDSILDGTSSATAMHEENVDGTSSATAVDGTSGATTMTSENENAACNSKENLGGAENE